MSYVEVIKQTLARHGNVADGMSALLDHCKESHPDPGWDEMAALDYEGGVGDIRDWLTRKAPIPDPVEVLWFAMWDVTTGFDLRGSTSWSRDPEDWEWWFHDDFHAGACAPPVLAAMHAVARRADDAAGLPPVQNGVLRLTDILLTLGFVSLAATQVLRGFESPSGLGRRNELCAVSGHPEEVYGIILGRLTERGFERFAQG